MPRRKEPSIPDALLDQLLSGADPKTAFDRQRQKQDSPAPSDKWESKSRPCASRAFLLWSVWCFKPELHKVNLEKSSLAG